jgi:hypothetical protein
VKVAKVDLSAARKEQTPYMPEIPDIPKCSPDLRASKQWEDAFVNHFSETRLVIYLVFSLFVQTFTFPYKKFEHAKAH